MGTHPAPTSAGAILELVRTGNVRTRKELQEITGLSRSTLSIRMAQLTSLGYLKETGQIAGSTGRPAQILSFDEDSQLVVGVDVGLTHMHIAIMDGGGQIKAKLSTEVGVQGPEETTRYLVKRISELVARSGWKLDQIAGIGVGLPGPVRFDTQRPNMPALMPGWHDFPLADRLSQGLGRPAYIDNDANLMALGEARERYAKAPSVLFVKIGTGIGAGVILHGEPERGMAGGAGNIGHIRIVGQPQGALCSCGATGCLATEASGGAILRILKERGIAVETTKDAVRLIQEGNAEALALSRRAGHLLGEVLATSVALLNPAVLVLGGAIPAACPTFVQAVRESIFERSVPMATRELNIAMSALGPDACLQGARHMVITQTFSAAAVDARLAAS